MSENDHNENFGCLQKFLIVAIVATVILIPSWACITRDIRITTTPPKPAPAPTATPSPLYVILTEQAKASAKVQVITAETDNEIRLRWNVHYMRRFWGWYFLIPLAVTLTTVILGIVIWVKLTDVLKDWGR